MKRLYKVYVLDANGWERECPDFETVFFGYGTKYVHPVQDGMAPCGHVLVRGYREAIALRDELNSQGDWKPADGSEAARPIYAIEAELK